MEVGVCRIVFGDLRSRLGKFINFGARSQKSKIEIWKCETWRTWSLNLKLFYKKRRVSLCPIRSQKTLYFDGVGIFIRRDFRGILEVSCVFLLRQILDFSTWLQYNIPYSCEFLRVPVRHHARAGCHRRNKSFSDRVFSSPLTERIREKNVSVC